MVGFGAMFSRLHKNLAIALFLSLLAVNTGFLQMVHLHQCDHETGCECAADHDSGSKEQPCHKHDSSKCLLCLQFAFCKALQVHNPDSLSFCESVSEQTWVAGIRFVSNTSPISISPRAPPLS
jgi:hypothetical protein